MERIALGEPGRNTTRLGFGLSGLMGAMGRSESLAVLEAAFDAGIRNFDVAPMYGYGEAESCLGEFSDVGVDLGEPGQLARLMLKAALVMNPASVILFSSRKAGHIQENVRVAGDASLDAPAQKFYHLMQTRRDELVPGSGSGE